MHRVVRRGLYTAATIVLLLACIAAYTAFLLNGDSVRLRVEASLSHTLGRSVSMLHLRLSPWTGTAVADTFQVADDPTFSSEPFIWARQVNIGLDMRELLLHHKIAVRTVALQQPAIRLLRNSAGTWNYTSLTRPKAAERPGSHVPNVSIATIAIKQGSVLVQTVKADGTAVNRAFTLTALHVHSVGAGAVSPFQLAAQLPAGGTIVATGTAGPWSRSGAYHLPVQANVKANHLQLVAAGLVAENSPVRGDVRQVGADIRWSDSGLHVSNLVVHSDRLVLNPGAPKAGNRDVDHTTATVWNRLLQQLVVDQASVNADAIEVHRQDGRTVQFRNVQATLGQWSPAARATFRVSTTLAGGVAHATGSFHMPDGQPADLEAEITTAHMHLSASGLLPERVAADAAANSTVHLRIAQRSVQAAGSFRLEATRLVHGAQPLAMPLVGSFRLRQSDHQAGGAGTLEALTVQFGAATLHAAGTYGWGAGAPTLHLTVSGDRIPVDALESALPSAGISLPEGSRLQGGTLTLTLDVQGALAHPEVNGPIRLEKTRLAGYDLGSKLRGLASFTNGRIGSATANGTELRRLSFVLHTGAGPLVTTDHLEARIAGIGTATGSGSIGPGGALDYRLVLKLNDLIPGAGGPAGLANEFINALPPSWARKLQGAVRYLGQGPMKNGVPLLIHGTARKPTVTPDLGALMPPERHR